MRLHLHLALSVLKWEQSSEVPKLDFTRERKERVVFIPIPAV